MWEWGCCTNFAEFCIIPLLGGLARDLDHDRNLARDPDLDRDHHLDRIS